MNIQKSPFMVEFLGTPEAGKTTTIHRLNDELSKKYKTSIIQESAEIVPSCFPKGTLEAHFWMRLNTSKILLEKQFSNDSDILLIDRGLIDTLFWNYYYGNVNKISKKMATHANTFFMNIGIKPPDIVIFLTTTPEESIRRRGGEGRVVTLDFVENFNEILHSFINEVTIPVYSLDTTGISQDEVLEKVLNKLSPS